MIVQTTLFDGNIEANVIKREINEKYDSLLETLRNSDKFEFKHLLDDRFTDIFNTYLDPILDNIVIPKRSYLNVIASLIYFILQIHYDIQPKFLRITKMAKCSNLKPKRVHNNKTRIQPYIQINKKHYENKIFMYIMKYYNELQKSIYPQIRQIKNEVLLKSYEIWYFLKRKRLSININEAQTDLHREIMNTIKKNKFDINLLFRKNYYTFFMPQYIALLCLQLGHQSIIEKSNRNKTQYGFNITRIAKITNVPEGCMTRLHKILRNPIQMQQNILGSFNLIKSKKLFLFELHKILGEKQTKAVLIIMQLFKYLNLTPEEFAKKVIPYKYATNARYVITYLKTKDFIKWITYKKIKQNIENLYHNKEITDKSYKKAKSLLDIILEKPMEKLFIHNGVTYSLVVLQKQIEEKITNQTLKTSLKRYLYQIYDEKYPKELFENKTILSGSQCKIRGVKNYPIEKINDPTIKATLRKKGIKTITEQIKTNTIRNKLINPLIRANKIKVNDPYLKEKFSEQAEKIILHTHKSDHPTIQKDLTEKKNSFIAELPVWIKRSDGKYTTGHIDLLDYECNKLQIIDYKRNIKEMIKHIPQICTYAYMLKQRLRIKDIETFECVLFCKDECWNFSPTILNQILIFLKNLNAKRTIRMLSLHKNHDLEHELSQILKTP